MNKEKIEQAKIEVAISNISRGIDIESAALILEKAILDNYIITKGRVNMLHLAVRQILYFIENSKIQNVGDKNILDYVKENVKLKEQIKYLEQKESILDKVTEYTENYIDDKQNEYEAISESYICQTDEDEYIKEKELAIIKGQKQVLKNVLNIIEGEKK